ncbi:hypothetical protein [Heyndrickxia camelliae]|uniref:Uncharacterized protein n=1 Tax=Heyndrickxia camelliae TaxID=1707093 RepID=A0A2N3LF40_9BACI|nr:hypothetical protein [Heyndrickxia camelliae]PKR83248.1 hypothetical protein CWO92_19790 [Heyndrickxia camelliae]
MYSIQQLQALDYLLKRIVNEKEYKFYKQDLKFVVEVKGSLWYGDFIQVDNTSAYQKYIDDGGDVETVYFRPDNGSKILQDIWKRYVEVCQAGFSNPFERIKDLHLLFNSLINILETTEIDESSSPFYPYLLNAITLDNKIELPFINLKGETVKLISIIENKK